MAATPPATAPPKGDGPAATPPRSSTPPLLPGPQPGPVDASTPPSSAINASQIPEISKIATHATGSTSNISIATTARQVYMDSLVPPSQEEFDRIARVQEEHESEIRRRSREVRRRSNSNLSSPHDPSQATSQDRHPHHENSLESHHSHDSASRTHHHFGPFRRHSEEARRAKAAQLIQRTYRGYRTRRQMAGFGLDASTRWMSAIREAQYREMVRPRARLDGDHASVLSGKTEVGEDEAGSSRPSTARENWRKVTTIARRAGYDEGESDSPSSLSSISSSDEEDPVRREEMRRKRDEENERRKKDARTMGLQYFLEMVDLKHRYGTNLRIYHEQWKSEETNENFFYWLDYGSGKDLEMDACPRDRLEREQVRYLSREERQYYLVEVDADGRLCWAKNGARIDTTEAYRDSIHGIVPQDDTTEKWVPSSQAGLPDIDEEEHRRSSTDSRSASSIESDLERARAAKYASPSFDDAKGVRKVSHLSASTIFNKLLRKSVRQNTWIFVADTSFRLYVGIKDSGAFQHSSFLQGSRISAAGLIKIKNGRLVSLSPLSGHYRPPAANFRAFVKSLKTAGVDMSRVRISKSYAVLVGLEVYVKTRRRGKAALAKLSRKKAELVAPEEVKRRDEAEKDKSESAEKERKTLEREEKEKRQREEEMREENRAAVKLMQKLHVAPEVPKGQKGDEHVEGAGQPLA